MRFKKFNYIGKEEIQSVNKVLKTWILSKFLGEKHKDFFGGPQVRKFEAQISKYFGVKYAATTNSWSSGLTCCVGALDIEPGDEIILPTLTMSACATAILNWNAIPVFADVDPKTFTISIDSILKNITKKTKAILAVDMFGLSCDIKAINKIAKKKNIFVITDSAQAIGSKYNGKYSGTLSDVGGFSFNYHKHIQTGEGGVCITNNKKIYNKIIHIRNHGEAVNTSDKNQDLVNNIGNNFRLGEIESAIGICQIKKLKKITKKIQKNAEFLNKEISNLKGISIPYVPEGQTHSYYIYAIKLKDELLKIYKRSKIVKELKKKGVPLREGCSNLHLQNMYKKKIAYGKEHFPWLGIKGRNSKISYDLGICPNAEKLKKHSMIVLLMTEFDFSKNDIKFITDAFKNVWKQLKINEKL